MRATINRANTIATIRISLAIGSSFVAAISVDRDRILKFYAPILNASGFDLRFDRRSNLASATRPQ
jgi:hypothetical protein